MFRSFIRGTLRGFARYKFFTAINLTGLVMGLTCSIFIMLWVKDELKYDSFHKNGPRLYRVLKRDFFGEGQAEVYPQAPGILVDALKAEVPEIEQGTQMSWGVDELITVGKESNKESGRYVQPDFLTMFTFPLVRGDAASALNRPTSIVISEQMAAKYFPHEDPIGKSVRINNQKEFEVTGILKDTPRNSSIRFDFLLHWDVFLLQNEWAKSWENNSPRAFVMLQNADQRVAVDRKIKEFVHKRVADPKTNISELFLQPYEDWYLHGKFTKGKQDGGRIDYVRSFSIVGIVVLLIACINFMNLATAQSLRRAKEIGIRKATGAARRWLVTQFLGESIVFSAISLTIALLVVWLALPAFQHLTGKPVRLPFSDASFVGLLAGIALITGLVSGSYPAFFLSSFDIVQVLKGTLKFGRGPIFLRKGLVVFQFSLTIVLIFCTLVVYRQLQFIKTKNLGFEKENLIVVNFEQDHKAKLDLVVNESSKVPGVKSVTISTTSPLVGGNSTVAVQWPGKSSNVQIAITQMAVGYDYLATMGIQLKEGRDFSRDFPSDRSAYVINETAARIMNLNNPLGQVITFWDIPGPIIGVAKDYHFNSLHNAIEPVILHFHPEWSNLMIVRAEAGRTAEALEGLKEVTKKVSPLFPFDYRFVDDTFEEQYRGEATAGRLTNYFSGMAVLISCLGLVGLIAFTVEQRTKEIGVRKVLGAPVASLYGLLSGDYLLLVAIAFGIAAPAGWFFMNNWLNGFAYRTTIPWSVFGVAAAAALGVSLLTISYQVLKAVMTNPIKSLRSE